MMISAEGYRLALADVHRQEHAAADAVSALVPLYGSLLFRVAHAALRNCAEAEDVVQETFLRVGKKIGQQQYSMVLAPGQRVQLKEGDRIPVMTGSVGSDPITKQATYLDVGFNFESTVTPYGTDGVRLQERVERSAIAQDKTSALAEDPIIRQSTVQGVANLTLGRPQHLGNIDVIGSTRQLQVDALIEVVK